MQKILLIDHNDDRLKKLSALLDSDFSITPASSFSKAIKLSNASLFDIIICEQTTTDFSLSSLTNKKNLSSIIIIDQSPTIEAAVSAIKSGAFAYLKNNDFEAISKAVSEIAEINKNKQTRIHGMLGQCDAMQQVYHYITKTAPTDCNVLILGETGTGKELAARAIHNYSHRKTQPLVCVNCAAIPQTLIESELFGYEKGAFTGANSARQGLIEAANNGTLFLDEIGELPMEAQARLLRFIQEGEIRRIGSTTPKKVNVRLITATHRDLRKLSTQNLFREDLFYRINVMQLDLPPLRERGDDILTIANTLLGRACIKFKTSPKQLSESAEALISYYTWPGNIRELENIIERVVILSDDEQVIIDADALSIEVDVNKGISQHRNTSIATASPSPVASNSTHIPTPVTDLARKAADPVNQTNDIKGLSLEDYFLRFVLKHQDSMSETELAKKLGISRKCLWERRNRLGIPRIKNSKA